MPNVPLRLATFNLENFDDGPDLPRRIAALRPLLVRADADVVCLQEVHSQGDANHRTLSALGPLLQGTRYAGYARASTLTTDGMPYNERNLVVLSRFPIVERKQYRNDLIPAPAWRMITADPPANVAKDVDWERPILHCKLGLAGRALHMINVHLKSKLPTTIPGQMLNQYAWKTVQGWAEGFFLSSVKRVGQALEVRMLLDRIFRAEPDALVAVAGDFNAGSDDVPVRAIRGDVAETGNGDLSGQLLVPCEASVPESSRYTLLHHGRGEMIDHLLVSRALLPWYRGAEIYNEVLPDESLAFATDKKFPESDHAPLVGAFAVPGEWLEG
jgi:endonuclease/exonuclease/phosphatase family metal-dependent hydrolase